MSGIDVSDPETIAFLAAALEAAGVDGIEIDQGTRRVRIIVERGVSRAVPHVETPHPSSRTAQSSAATAPIAGIFCRDHPATIAPPLALPREVVSGDTLGFVRVGPVVLPVRASETGVLTRFAAEDGSLVGYGDPLFEIEPRP